MGVNGDRLGTVSKIRSEYAQGETRYTKSRREPGEKKLMVNGVKGCRKVQKYKGGWFTLVNCKKKVVLNAKKGSFCGMEFSVGGLEWGDSRKGL